MKIFKRPDHGLAWCPIDWAHGISRGLIEGWRAKIERPINPFGERTAVSEPAI